MGTIDTAVDLELVRRAIGLGTLARSRGDHPFGALLADADGRVLLTALNRVESWQDTTAHAETRLVSLASRLLTRRERRAATLVTSAEPCAMCAGAIYWAGIGRVGYGLAESSLLALTGADPANPTLSLPCRTVFAAGQRPIDVFGPCLEEEAAVPHEGFWRR